MGIPLRNITMIKVVFFDLGSTLVYSSAPWQPFYERADRALVDVLRNNHVDIDPAGFYNEFGGFVRAYYEERPNDNYEQTTFSLLKNVLSQKGFKNIPELILRSALEAMYAVTQQNWFLEDDAKSTLETLISAGFCLGLISNTSDDNNIQKILDQWELRSYFETIVTSAALGIRKPDIRIFKIALDQMHIQPASSAMVGDTLEADVLGANLAGIYSIWLTRRAHLPEDGNLPIQPQAVVSSLCQIPDLLHELNLESLDNPQ
jgi:HAD superfamily hydrolase (TIGR01549 family)